VPPERVDQTIAVKPSSCQGCGAALTGDDPHPDRRQVIGLPQKIRAWVIEYLIHTLACCRCGRITKATVPDEAQWGFDPRLTALVALLSGVYHLSRRNVQAILGDLLGVNISLGSVVTCEQRTSAALAAPVAEAREYAKKQPVKYADETAWYEGISKKRIWLWVARVPLVTVFLIRAFRNSEVAKELLGDPSGVLVTDRWSAYMWWPIEQWQTCWSHHKRYFKGFEEAGGKAGRIGRALLDEERLLFQWWHRVRDGTLSRSTFREYVRGLRARVKRLLEQGTTCGHRKTEGVCRKLLAVEPAMWTFVRVKGVEPTNNCSERSLRPAVIWRKISYGTHSTLGSRYVERMMSATFTLRQQGRHVLGYLTAAVEGAIHFKPGPSILPAIPAKSGATVAAAA
jgi:transposase